MAFEILKDIKLLYCLKIQGNFTGQVEFCLVVKLHWEGSAPAACAVGLLLYEMFIMIQFISFTENKKT